MRDIIYKYLGYQNIEPDKDTDKLIDECIKEVKEKANFKYIYQEFTDILPFLQDNDNYLKYLEGSTGYLIVGSTLGIEIDRLEKIYQKTDMTKALVFDCVASAYIEELSDEYESNLRDDLNYRFCPGYQNTSFLDNQIISKILNAPKYLGITFLDSSLMVPLKSMMGIVSIGNKSKRSCMGCMFMKNCKYLKGGQVCYKK